LTALAKRPATGDLRRVRHRLVGLQRRMPIMQTVALIALSVYAAASLQGLASGEGLVTVLVIASIIGLASVGQTLVVLLGGFDLSIPGFMVASAYAVTTIREQYGLSFIVALLLAVVICAGLGALSGWICAAYQVQPLIVTLGMGSALAGLAQGISAQPSVGAAPGWAVHVTSLGSRTLGLGIPPVIVIWVAVTLIATAMLHRTVFGRRLMATGANYRGAEYSLIDARRVWATTFALSGVVSVFSGLLVAGFAGSLNSTAAQPYLFQTLLAVIVGGTIFGGPGDYLRTVIGALFLAVLNIVLVGSGAAAPDQDILYGAILVVSVTLYGRERRLRERV
jgi:ribose transport system permease protein